ncbi:UNVERIFIED_CONTAM: Transposon Ty3-G Gag-Pol polyprotein [Sesamum calycinum]|uniref:Transposon Ty3-G Gag-Pol polyprotein n=1 Tax=Sesamum calycinum TaxID=2727403 RepID=A0AAW2QK82_9LAMI
MQTSSTQGNDDTIDARGLLALIHNASTRAPPKPWLSLRATPHQSAPPSPRRSRELSSAPEEEEQRQEEVNSRVSPEVAQTQEHPFSTNFSRSASRGRQSIQPSEYDGTGDPQEHLDKFYAKIDCLEQLTQRFLHHFSMNKRVPKTAAFLFTIRQRENEPLRDYAKGHTTEECHHLKNEIEKLIQRGHLRQYVNREQSRQPQETASTQHPNSDNLPTAGVIAVISGGPAGGDSANARKALVRAARRNNWQTPNQIHNINSDKQGEIAFGEQDLDPMRNQNNDALVISATLSNFWVKKVLVDSGSSADIIFYDAYVQLGVDNAQLRKEECPIKKEKENDGHGPRDKGRPRGTLRKNRRERRVEAVEELKVINLSEDDEKTTKIGTTMRPSTKEHLIQFLKKNKEVFAWTMTDLHGISPDVITHKLSVNPSAKPVKQKKRMFGAERSQAIKEEVDKMLQAGYIRPVQYPEWLANVVLVPKPNGKWRLCIDFTDLNKACPKDPFPLPRIDILVDSTSGRSRKSELCNGSRGLLLQRHALQLKKCRSDIPTTCQSHVSKIRLAETWRAYLSSKSSGAEQSLNGPKNGQEAFDELKKYLVSPPLLTKPETGETLYLYLAVSENAVSSVLVRQENREHLLVYYVSKVLQGAEPRYSQIEKLALSLVIAARKLRPYFQSHQVTVLTNHPLKQLLASPKLSGRMVKWAVELSEYGIEFHPRPAIKAQVLADFVVELAYDEASISTPTWSLYVDDRREVEPGCPREPQGDKFEYAIKLDFPSSNNEAEYEAFLAGGELALAAGAKGLSSTATPS